MQELGALKIFSLKSHAMLDGIENGTLSAADAGSIWKFIKVSDHEGYAQNNELHKATTQLFTYISPDMARQFGHMDHAKDIDPIVIALAKDPALKAAVEADANAITSTTSTKTWHSLGRERQRQVIAYFADVVNSADAQHICTVNMCMQITVLQELKHKQPEFALTQERMGDVLNDLGLASASLGGAGAQFLGDAKTRSFFHLTDNAEQNVLKISESLAKAHLKLDAFDADGNAHIGLPELTAAMKAAMEVQAAAKPVASSAPAHAKSHA